ncbi:MAG: MBL fold metallo-hydrolase [Methanobacteriota archaeon]|nr:MAG: MBL fold metallo-hydrolase [Euryarchaeota archaeon]
MKIEGEFLGGGHEVGRLGIYLKCDGARLLFDYGMTATAPPLYPKEAPPIDRMFLTHSHLDHCGMIPWLTARYDIDVVATAMAREVAILLMEDSIKVGQSEGYPEPYDVNDVKIAKRRFREIDFGETMDIGRYQIMAHPAGHIPGATMFELRGRETTLVTGDIHTIDTRLVKGAKPVRCDNLIMEATYSGRNHADRKDTERAFLHKIDEVLDRDGRVIIAAFAVGRTQEILLLLKNHRREFWLDGMGRKVSKIYSSMPEFLLSGKSFRQAANRAKVVRSAHGRTRAARSDIVVTTSGMLDGGPVIDYIDQLKEDPKSAILLTGYQVEGSNGRMLLDQGVIDVKGATIKVNCDVKIFDFSAHAGHDQLLDFAKGCSPERIVLCHGDQRELLADDLRKEGFEVLLPRNGEKFGL